MSRLERILVAVIAAALAVLATGTVVALVAGSPARKAAREAVPEELAANGVYDGIGRVRAKSADGAVVLAHVAFPYDAGDRQFREELRQKRPELKAAVIAFFSSKTAAELDPSAESAVKAALRDVLNAGLLMGKIDELYLAEFRVLP